MSKIIITGGSGFIGTNVVQYYLDKGWDVINISRSAPQIDHHRKFWKRASVTEITSLSEIILGFDPDFIIHLAGRTDFKGKNLDDYRVNVDGVRNIIEIASLCKSLKKIIFASSSLASNPCTVYGESKAKGEQEVFRCPPQCDWSIIRPTAIWGPWFHNSYYTFFKSISKGRYFNINHVNSKKTFGYVGNTAYQIDCVLSTDTKAYSDKVFYLGDYEPYDIRVWAEEIAAKTGKRISRVPYRMAKCAAVVGDLLTTLRINFPLTSQRLSNMRTDHLVDLKEIKKIAYSLPFSREKGISETIEWIQNN